MSDELMNDWIGVALDGTLAYYGGWQGIEHIGVPIPRMLERVKQWIAEGRTVKILTARAGDIKAVWPIMDWLKEHGIGGLEITDKKDFGMIELWDDRCVQIISNTGLIATEVERKIGFLESHPDTIKKDQEATNG
jgi:hypothetical protein